MSQQKEEEIIWCQNQIIIQQFFSENLLAIEMRKTQSIMNKPVYLALSILELSKILMYEFWYLLCHMDADSFIVYIRTDDL